MVLSDGVALLGQEQELGLLHLEPTWVAQTSNPLCPASPTEPTRKVSPTSFSPRHQDPGMTPQAPHPSAALLLLAPQIFPITLKGYPPRQQDLHGTRVQAGL